MSSSRFHRKVAEFWECISRPSQPSPPPPLDFITFPSRKNVFEIKKNAPSSRCRKVAVTWRCSYSGYLIRDVNVLLKIGNCCFIEIKLFELVACSPFFCWEAFGVSVLQSEALQYFWSTDLITTLPSCCNTLSFKLARCIRCHVKLKPWAFRWWWVSLFSSPDRLAKHRYYQEKLTHLSLLEVKLKYWNGKQDILEFIFIN